MRSGMHVPAICVSTRCVAQQRTHDHCGVAPRTVARRRTADVHRELRDGDRDARTTDGSTRAPACGAVRPTRHESQAPFDPGFTGILEESDLVIEADIETKFVRLSQDGDQVLWSQLIDNVDVIRSRATPAPHVDGLYAYGDPGQPPYGWPPGRYVLLLLPLRGGLSTPSEGMWGMFRIAGDRALRFCPNYDDPAHPIAASGTPPTVDELLALIPTQLPTDSVAPKPTTAISP
jgi:hypothetical protein